MVSARVFEVFLRFGAYADYVTHCRSGKMLTQEQLQPLHKDLVCSEILHNNKRFIEQRTTEPLDDTTIKRQPVSLMWQIWMVVRWDIFFLTVLGCVRSGAAFLQVYALNTILAIVNHSKGAPSHWAVQYLFVGIVALGAFLQSLAQHSIFHRSFINGLRVRALLSGQIFRKALQQTPLHQGLASSGKQINLFTTDANAVVDWMSNIIFLSTSLMECIGAIVWIACLIGWAAAATAGTFVILLPALLSLGRVVSLLRAKTFVFTDMRVHSTGEFLGGINVVKLCAWEKPVYSAIAALRGKEEAELMSANMFKILNLSFYYFSPGIFSLVTFGVMCLYDDAMDPKKTFVVIALLQIISRAFTFFPRSITPFGAALISVDRIDKFLSLDLDMPANGVASLPQTECGAVKGTVSIHGSFGWQSADVASPSPSSSPSPHGRNHFCLDGVDIDCAAKTLTVIIGPVGAGKSTLLHALMNNCAKFGGNAVVGGRVAYVSQEAWMCDGTVRDNILFGSPFEERKYREVLHACALLPDIMQWGGDLAEVGERGVTLSGGQRQRISVARACYHDADVYLMDDPISAVDSHVAQYLMDRCLRGYLRDKTVILATHHPKPLEYADQIIVLDHGHQVEKHHRSADENFSKLKWMPKVASPIARQASFAARNSAKLLAQCTNVDSLIGSGHTVTSTETSSAGAVSFAVYMRYIRAGGRGYSCLLCGRPHIGPVPSKLR